MPALEGNEVGVVAGGHRAKEASTAPPCLPDQPTLEEPGITALLLRVRPCTLADHVVHLADALLAGILQPELVEGFLDERAQGKSPLASTAEPQVDDVARRNVSSHRGHQHVRTLCFTELHRRPQVV